MVIICVQLVTVRDANQFDSVQAIWIAWYTSHLHACNNDSGMEVLSECLLHPHHISVRGAVGVQRGLQEYQGGGGQNTHAWQVLGTHAPQHIRASSCPRRLCAQLKPSHCMNPAASRDIIARTKVSSHWDGAYLHRETVNDSWCAQSVSRADRHGQAQDHRLRNGTQEAHSPLHCGQS